MEASDDATREWQLTASLKAATIKLRDCELAMRQAQAEYKAAIEAFSRHVAPSQP